MDADMWVSMIRDFIEERHSHRRSLMENELASEVRRFSVAHMTASHAITSFRTRMQKLTSGYNVRLAQMSRHDVREVHRNMATFKRLQRMVNRSYEFRELLLSCVFVLGSDAIPMNMHATRTIHTDVAMTSSKDCTVRQMASGDEYDVFECAKQIYGGSAPESERDVTFVCTQSDAVVASIVVHVYAVGNGEQMRDVVYVKMISVLPNARRMGHASRLLRSVAKIYMRPAGVIVFTQCRTNSEGDAFWKATRFNSSPLSAWLLCQVGYRHTLQGCEIDSNMIDHWCECRMCEVTTNELDTFPLRSDIVKKKRASR